MAEAPKDRYVACARIAGRQHGCISFEQAVATGMSADAIFRLVRRGMWRRLLPRVYVVAGNGSSWHQRLMAAQLWLGGECAVSDAAAAALHGIPGFPPGQIELATTADRRSRVDVVVHRVKDLPAHEVGRRGALRVTSATRTLIDISRTTDPETFEIAFHDCLYRRIVSLGRMRTICTVRRGPGAAGAPPLLREMLTLYREDEPPPESPLEVRVRRLLAAEKLAPPVRQYPVSAGGRQYRIDLACPSAQVAIEVDGYRWHSNRLSWDKDHLKVTALQGAGWYVVHATYRLLTEDRDVFLGAIRRALGHRLPIDGL